MDRRTFLRLGLGTAALATARPILGRDPALAQPAPGPFGHGVASGDPLADRVVIWTRVTPSDDATPGSGRGAATPVTWEVATDAAFTDVVASGSVTTSSTSDHTVKVDVGGLRPFTEHWYRFRALGATSPVGRTKTAPAEDAQVDSLRFGVVSCSNYEGGYFSAYRHLAARDDLDLVVHLGDYIYETGRGAYGPGAGFGRAHDPDHEIVTLEDYRRRHALHKADADLAAVHARYAFVTTIDDHEVTDNTWASGAGNHQADEGLYSARKATAMQAYFEWMPIRPSGDADEPNRIYRHLSLGGLADLFVLDERGYRSKQAQGLSEDMIVTSPEVRDPSRTMLGADQLAWLEEGLRRSDAQWRIVANSVMFSPLVVADLPDVPEVTEVTELLQTVLAGLDLSVPLVINADQWDGYAAEQAHLTQLYRSTGGVVVLTGDIHSSWAAEVPVDPGTYMVARGGPTAAVEFVTPAVTSNSFSDSIGGIIPGGEVLVPHLPLVVDLGAPWFKYLDPDSHGFGVFEITAAAVQYDWHYISDRTDPQATERVGQSWRSPAGSNKLQAARPLGPRTAVPAPPPPPADPDDRGGADGGADGAGGGPAPGPSSRLPATGGAGRPGVAVVAAAAGALGAAAARTAARQDGRAAPGADEEVRT